MAGVENANSLSPDTLKAAIEKVMENPLRRAAQNSATRSDHSEVLIDRARSTSYNHHYSVTVEKENKITNQKASGRCWMFAALNVARTPLIEKMDLPRDFELSQSWCFFWEKIERANYFLTTMVELAAEPLDSRLIQHLLACPMNDGGQWDMFAAIVEKYGLVPKSVFPESFSSSNSRRMNWILTHKLRGWASELRSAPPEDRVAMIQRFLEETLGILLVSLGTPPTEFDWEYKDKDGKYHMVPGLTPLQFYHEYVRDAGFDFSEWISLINDPRNEYGKLYTVDYLGNVVGGPAVRYINVDITTMKKYTSSQLDKGQPVWFGCDVGKHFNRKLAVMDTKLYDFDLIYGTAPSMDKRTRLLYNDSLMTHAMVFTGYDQSPDGERTTKWRVENSWGSGEDNGPGAGCPYSLCKDGGFYLMTDEWFDEYMYQIIVRKSDLDPALVEVEKSEATALPAWDPMGALATLRAPDSD